MSSEWGDEDEAIQWVSDEGPTPPPPPPPPLGQQVGVGAGLGALGGVTFLGWETAVTGWVGLQPALGVLPIATLLLYASTGGLFGALAGLGRKRDSHWAAITMCLVVPWLVAGQLGALIGSADASIWLAFPLLFALGILAGYFGIAENTEEPTAGAIAVALFLCLAILLPIDAHLFVSLTSPAALGLNGAALVITTILGGLTAMVLADGVLGIRGLIGVGAVVGWVAALPVLRPAYADWPQAGRDDRPPLVLVVVGGLRADHLGIYGNPRANSPAIDEAAAGGLVYADASTAAPWTLPAVASILTGQLPSHHGAGMSARGVARERPLSPRPRVLAEDLEGRGYTSVGITTSTLLARPFGLARGFSSYDDRTGPAALPAALRPLRTLHLDPFQWPAYLSATEVTDRAIDFVQAQKRSSWFLLVHYMDPHLERTPPQEDLVAVGALPDHLSDTYDGAVHHVDRQVGRLLEVLPEQAWVVITADHGVELGERRPSHHPASDGVRYGHTLFEEQLHVPLIVLGPGLQPTWVERPVPSLDIAPTLLVLAGAQPGQTDGVPLHEVVPESAAASPRTLVAEAVRYGPETKSARIGRYKLIYTRDEGGRLYDLTVDPRERSPIRQLDREKQTIIRELEALLPPFPR
ncbi:MAG: sulfatase-like hydrolase/transferase [Deltaproteobacteria bacterium]|nr:sulfatase-like hydrolase/transferase [Deltaproteobacteria bacterium]